MTHYSGRTVQCQETVTQKQKTGPEMYFPQPTKLKVTACSAGAKKSFTTAARALDVEMSWY